MVLLTVLSDAYHGLPRRVGVEPERYYYTNSERFEQSLDIYRPPVATHATTKANDDNNSSLSSSSSRPIVALVVGSAWIGHRSIIYSGTSWWNSSGPKAVAELGYVCVCIRHRGSFMKALSLLTLAYVLTMVAIVMAIAQTYVDHSTWLSRKEFVILATAVGLFLIDLAGVGAASFEEMQHDVLDALEWLHSNPSRLERNNGGIITVDPGSTTRKRRPFIFGGYSSGGHVAATVVQNSTMWTARNLPHPHIHCDYMLYISPVLSTKSHVDVQLPYVRTRLSNSSSSSSSSSVPSLASSSETESMLESDHRSNYNQALPTSDILDCSPPPPPPPTWLTDQVLQAVFGRHVAPTIPSPFHTHSKSPHIGHTFLGCKREMFGLNWLDTFFCSAKYSEALNRMGIASRYVSIESDHWSILDSQELKDVLRIELKRIEYDWLTSERR